MPVAQVYLELFPSHVTSGITTVAILIFLVDPRYVLPGSQQEVKVQGIRFVRR